MADAVIRLFDPHDRVGKADAQANREAGQRHDREPDPPMDGAALDQNAAVVQCPVMAALMRAKPVPTAALMSTMKTALRKLRARVKGSSFDSSSWDATGSVALVLRSVALVLLSTRSPRIATWLMSGSM